MNDALLTQGELAERLLRDMFATADRILVRDAISRGREHGVGRKAMVEARKRLGITEIHNGPKPGFWQAPPAIPDRDAS